MGLPFLFSLSFSFWKGFVGGGGFHDPSLEEFCEAPCGYLGTLYGGNYISWHMPPTAKEGK